MRLLLAALLILVGPPAARADGFKFLTDGRKVPEHEQRAFIEWADGTETLHVAALGDPTTEGTVWIVPVRAAASAVRAEPVERFPAVVYYETLKSRAERQLRDAIAVAQFLDSGGFFCLPWLGCGGGGPKAATEVARIERLGMVVVVLSAESRAALEQYLDAQGMNRAAADLSSLDPYFGKPDFAFVCGWVAKRGEPVTATALKVVFPSPTLWFPLQPTRAYTNPVETVVYVRGFVKPDAGCNLPGLHCQYIFGDVKELGIGQAFEKIHRGDYYSDRAAGHLEQLTRVTLTTNPQQWDRDLELVSGTTTAGSVAIAVTGWAGFYGPIWSGLLGAILGLAFPWLTIAKDQRSRIDWLAGALTGAAIVLTIWASALVFTVWRNKRFIDRPRQPSRFLVLPALAIAHFAIVYVLCRGLIAWISAGS